MQATLNDSLNQTATVVHRAVGTPDAEGNPAPGATTTTDYPARLMQTLATDILDGEQRVRTEWRVLLPYNAVVDADDELLIGGVRYQVVGQPAAQGHGSQVIHLSADLRLVD